MSLLRYTLVCDGSSDQNLLSVIDWLLHNLGLRCPLDPRWADFSGLLKKPKNLAQKIEMAVDLYPCDILFIHRDAERESPERRAREICAALREASGLPACVIIIPVRMQEAWLLLDVQAIRIAAGNPSGATQLNLPAIKQLESLPDPKEKLYSLLKTASGLKGRRLVKFNERAAARRVAELIEDYSPLLRLPAFLKFRSDLLLVLRCRFKDLISN